MSMYPIASALATGSNDLAFTNIPQNFTHLQIRVFLRSTNSGAQDFNYVRINSDFGSNYVSHGIYGNGSGAVSDYYNARSYNWLTDIPGSSAAANIYGVAIIDILDYTNTNKYKTIKSIGGYDANGSGTVQLASGLWMSTAAITSITCSSGNNVAAAGSTAQLYGITTA